MKKIVALVLSLVMVLGLATTAFGVADEAAKSYGGLYAKTTDMAAATASDLTLEYYAAEAPEYNKDKTLKDLGCIAFYMIGDEYFVKADAVKDADVVVYKDAAMKKVFMYLTAIDNPFYMGTGVAFTNFGEDCGQVDYEPAKNEKFYTFGAGYFQAVEASDDQLMVAGKLVPVAAVDFTPVMHTAAYTIEDGKVIAVECSACGLKAVYATNWMSVPEFAQYVEDYDAGYWYWAAAAAPAGDATVESPKTFDAGIAMYVGMSVMAAAGSAVVLKKKD